MIRWRKVYWLCPRLADWGRRIPKPSVATSDEWTARDTQAKASHPWRFWMAETALDKIQDIVCLLPDVVRTCRVYVVHRFVKRTNALVAAPTHIRPGEWCDLSVRLLPAMFDALADFVEVELAWHHVVCDDSAFEKYGPTRWQRALGRVGWRSAEAGLANLDRQGSLIWNESSGVAPSDPLHGQSTPQSNAASEIKELYLWWTQIYPSRPDPEGVSGWSAFCEGSTEQQKALEARAKEILDRVSAIEAAYAEEDEMMMIRLIKVRHYLWT